MQQRTLWSIAPTHHLERQVQRGLQQQAPPSSSCPSFSYLCWPPPQLVLHWAPLVQGLRLRPQPCASCSLQSTGLSRVDYHSTVGGPSPGKEEMGSWWPGMTHKPRMPSCSRSRRDPVHAVVMDHTACTQLYAMFGCQQTSSTPSQTLPLPAQNSHTSGAETTRNEHSSMLAEQTEPCSDAHCGL